jgi:subtilase family serine protease
MRLHSALAARMILTLLVMSTLFSAHAQRNRIASAIDGGTRTTIKGNVHPLSRSAADRGKLANDRQLQRVTLVFRTTAAQQAALDALLERQQNPVSPDYHKWLTPEQYADNFGLSTDDFNKVADWLRSQGFTVVDAARSRTWIAFNGSARQVASALQTDFHQYLADGKLHFANTSAPVVPATLADVLLGIRNLDDFHPKPRYAIARKMRPNFTSSISGNHFLAPDDFATIYNLQPLYLSGLDGTGQKIAVVGQTSINLSDIQSFRSASNLPAKDPEILLVPGSKDPGIVSGDIDEANLDIQWSGAVARNATIVYVNSANGAFDSLQYAIDSNVAPVISVSYGNCEQNFSATEMNIMAAIGKQANAQGQTIVAAAGDSGAADCDYDVGIAQHGLAVDIPAGLPYVTGIGGTTFDEGTASYWNAANNTSSGSAISYIPEIIWNDTAYDVAHGGSLASSGGGSSTAFPKPTWQTGAGVPDDGARDVPDISFAASADHDGFLVCSQGDCVNGYRAADNTLTVMGGTSAGAPAFAGILALINQKAGSPQGNVNPTLYSLAATSPGVFHDIVTGDNKVPCFSGTKDCPTGGGSIGYSAGTGYDLASGLGSVDAHKLVSALTGDTATGDFQLASNKQTLTLSRGSSGTATLTATALNGFASTISLACNVSSSLSGTTCAVNPASVSPAGTATLTITAPVQTAALPSGRMSSAAWLQACLVLPLGFLSLASPIAGRLRAKRKARHIAVPLLMLLVLVGAATSCGGGGGTTRSNATGQAVTATPLTGTVTVQATSGSLTHSVTVAVTVN